MSDQVSPSLNKDEGISAEEFAELLIPLAPFSNKVAVAVSGGPDSMALAHLLKRWGKVGIIAFVVDHRLRDESSEEAIMVAQSLLQMGIQSEILVWEHQGVAGRLHEKARRSRYELLIHACRAHQIYDLFIGHHSDDQIETILMRLSKGSGVDGLSGIASVSQREGIRLVRPLLSIPKARLIASCHEAALSFVNDPSNSSAKYARGRLRNIMPLLAAEGMTTESLLNLGARASEAKEALEFYTASLLARAAKSDLGGSLKLNRQKLAEVPKAIGIRAITACLRYIHEDDYPPEHAALAQLWKALCETKDDITRTLSGALVSANAEDIHFLREASAACEELTPLYDRPFLWDNRWLVTLKSRAIFASVPQLMLRALGNPPHSEIDSLSPHLRHDIPQGRVRATLPALWSGERLCALPSFEEEDDFAISYKKRAFP